MPVTRRFAVLLTTAFAFPMALVVTASAVTSMVPGLRLDGRLLCNSENRLVSGYFRPICVFSGDGPPKGGTECHEVDEIRKVLIERMKGLWATEFQDPSHKDQVQSFIRAIESKTPAEDTGGIQLCGGADANVMVGQILGL